MKSLVLGSTIAVFILSTALAQGPSPGIYTINASRSSIELTVFRTGILKALGHDHVIAAKVFSGEVRLDAANLGDSSVSLSIESGSLIVLDDPKLSEKDRKEVQANMQGPKVLNIQQFPKISFQSTGFGSGKQSGEDYTLRGRLNLHGVDKEIAFPVRVHPEKNLLRVTGTAVIAQTDFGIQPIKGAARGLRVKDPVNIKFDILAEKAN